MSIRQAKLHKAAVTMCKNRKEAEMLLLKNGWVKINKNAFATSADELADRLFIVFSNQKTWGIRSVRFVW